MKIEVLSICAAVTVSLISGAKAIVEFRDATPDELVQWLAPGLVPSEAKLTGHPDCAKIFSKARYAVRGQPFPDSGVVLSTGRARNLDRQTGGATGACLGRLGDPDLESIAGFQTRDACALEFDFYSPGGVLFFNYVFASEEYPESIDSPVNDEFALFLNGENLALIPGSATTISIKNVNNDINHEYFNDNDPDEFGLSNTPYPYFQPDGFTTKLTASGLTVADAINKVKLVITDGGDCSLDSWVLIEKKSFTFTPPPCPSILSTPRLEPVSMGSQLGGTVIKIKNMPCDSGTDVVYCRFEGFATSMDEVVPGTIPTPGTIECVTPYAGSPSAVVVSFAFHDLESGAFDKFTATWTAAHKEFMYYGDVPQVKVKVGANDATVLNAETDTTITWNEPALTDEALESLNFDPPPIGLIAADLTFSIQVVAFDDNEAQAFQEIQLEPNVAGGSASLTVDDGAISSYTQNYGGGPMAIVMVRVVASYDGRIGAIASSGLVGVFPNAVAPQCAPAPPAYCEGINALPQCPPTVSYVMADLDFFPDEYCGWYQKGPGCSSFTPDVGGCFRAYGPVLTGQRCCYSTQGALLPGRYIGRPGLEGPATADCVATGRHIFGNALHFAFDVVPHHLCCTVLPANCFRYYNNRPSSDGVLGTYQRPTLPGWAFGDPHIRTLDGSSYTFNGAGEYVAFCGVQDANGLYDGVLDQCSPENLRLTGARSALSVHLRFAPVTTGTGKATAVVGVAIEDPQHQSGLRAIAVVPHPTRRVDVMDGSKVLDLDNAAVDLATKVLYLSSGAKITRSGNLPDHRAIAVITIETPSGLRLKIMEKGGVMFPNLEVHPNFMTGVSVGLMGLADGNPMNDLTSSLGLETDFAASDEEIFNDFGRSWRIDNIGWSLFQDLTNRESFGKYDDPDYKPSFVAPVVPQLLRQKADAACALIKDEFIRDSCKFDIVVSGNVDLFRASSEMAFKENQYLRVRTNSLPTIKSTTPKATVKVGDRAVLPFTFSDPETPKNLFVGLKPGPLFSLQISKGEGKGNVTFAGSATPGTYATWLTVSDDSNSVLSTFVVKVWAKGVTNKKTCANIIKNCRCTYTTKNQIRKCAKNEIFTKKKCVPPGFPSDDYQYVEAVVDLLVLAGKTGCP